MWQRLFHSCHALRHWWLSVSVERHVVVRRWHTDSGCRATEAWTYWLRRQIPHGTDWLGCTCTGLVVFTPHVSYYTGCIHSRKHVCISLVCVRSHVWLSHSMYAHSLMRGQISVNRWPNLLSVQPRWLPRSYLFNHWCFDFNNFAFIIQF